MSLKQKIMEKSKTTWEISYEYIDLRDAYMKPNERQKLLAQKYVLIDDVLVNIAETMEQIREINIYAWLDEMKYPKESVMRLILEDWRTKFLAILEGETP